MSKLKDRSTLVIWMVVVAAYAALLTYAMTSRPKKKAVTYVGACDYAGPR